MSDRPRKRITIDAPSPATILAARHLDATEGGARVSKTVTSADRSAIDQVLHYISHAHNTARLPEPPRRPCRHCTDPQCPEDCPECGTPIHELTPTPTEEPCGQKAGAVPHPPHKYMRNGAVYQCPGDTTPAAPAAEVAALENRLRLAHQARRAKEHQLDGIRRALCDAGFMEDGDPYSHADLEDVIRQAAPRPSCPDPVECGHEAALARIREFLDRDQDGLCCSHLVGQLRAALDGPPHTDTTEAAEDLSDYYAPDPPIGCLTATTTPASSDSGTQPEPAYGDGVDLEIGDPHEIGQAHSCPEECPTHNPGGPDVPRTVPTELYDLAREQATHAAGHADGCEWFTSGGSCCSCGIWPAACAGVDTTWDTLRGDAPDGEDTAPAAALREVLNVFQPVIVNRRTAFYHTAPTAPDDYDRWRAALNPKERP